MTCLGMLGTVLRDKKRMCSMGLKFGELVAVEGDDGAGKTTFIKHLKERHPEYVYSREPGGSSVSEQIRELLLSDQGRSIDPATRLHLFWASRAENINTVIRPALEAGKVVVTDRFDASTFAFQVGGDEEEGLKPLFWKIREFHLRYLPIKYLFFNLPSSVAEERLRKRGGETNHFDEQGREYRNRVSRHYSIFFNDERVRYSHFKFNSDLPESEMLAKAYEMFQKLIA